MINISNIYDSEPRTIGFGKVRVRWPFPISYMMGSSSARVFGRPVFGSSQPFWLMPTFRAFHWAYKHKWKLLHRYHPNYQYNVVKTGLEPGYYDVDILMLNAVMSLVCRYVEDERGGEAELERWGKELADPANTDPNAPEGVKEQQGQNELDVLDIYRWWKHEKPADEASRNKLMRALYGGKGRVSWKETTNPNLHEMVFKEFEGDEVAMEKTFWALEAKIDSDEQKYLHLAIDYRRSMWS